MNPAPAPAPLAADAARSFRRPLLKLGFVPANRGIFDTALAAAMRRETLAACAAALPGVEIVVPQPGQTREGLVETIAEAEACAELFRAARVDGILVGAVNFGDEQGVAWTVKQADLRVPILIFGCQEEEVLTPATKRRDAFCGLLSIGEVLRQIGAPYSVALKAVCFPRDAVFHESLGWFAGVCRVVAGLRRARYGQAGARPDGFWTCRFDEKALQALGPTTVTLDLSEVVAAVGRLPDGDPEVAAVLDGFRAYADLSAVGAAQVRQMAKLEVVLARWAAEKRLDACAIQCWTSMQFNLGICSCAVMSRLGDRGFPAACEADILGTMSMHALQLASGTPAALADWNNLHNVDDDLVNLWHCGVFPRSFARAQPHLRVHAILDQAGIVAPEKAQGIVDLRVAPGPASLCRITQDRGQWKVFLAEGDFEDNPATTIGSYGWCRIPGLQALYRDVLLQHFPHHVAVTQGRVGRVLEEALGKYLGIAVYGAARTAG